MRPAFRDSVRAVLVAWLTTLFITSCGGGGGSPQGDTHGEDTPPVVVGLVTPSGLYGARGLGTDVPFSLRIADAEFDRADLEVEFGVDGDEDGYVSTDEFFSATVGAGGDGLKDLQTSPGTGSGHLVYWNCAADLPGGRFLPSDVVRDANGRAVTGEDGEPLTEELPGVVIRMRAVGSAGAGAWCYSTALYLNNNSAPGIGECVAEIPPEGVDDSTVNEDVVVGLPARDADGQRLTVLLDWLPVPEDFDPSILDADELAALDWRAGEGHVVGATKLSFPGTAEWRPVHVVWDSVHDAGTVEEWILLRYCLLDESKETSAWACLRSPVHLDNLEVFTDSSTALSSARGGVRTARLPEGRILVTGGRLANGAPTAEASVFRSETVPTAWGLATPVPGGMHEARCAHSMTPLPDGRVLVAGGAGPNDTVLDSAEIYDPASNRFEVVDEGLWTARRDHVAIRLPGGEVLLAGGTDPAGSPLATSEIFDPSENAFRPGPSFFGGPRTGARAVRLPDGRILVAGGSDGSAPLSSVEIYDPGAGLFVVTDVDTDVPFARSGLELIPTVHPSIGAVALGGTGPSARSIGLFDYRADRWSVASATLEIGHTGGGVTCLADGRILVVAGVDPSTGGRTRTAEIYDVAADVVVRPHGDLPEALDDVAAVAMPNGLVALVGGVADSGPVSSITLFTPAGGGNAAPSVQIATPGEPQRLPYGVGILWRGVDAERDPVRITAEYRVDASSGDDSGRLADERVGRWLPATAGDRVTFGAHASGLSGLSTVESPSDEPIDAPDLDPGEHVFVWKAGADLPPGDYDRVSFRITPSGAVPGEAATTGEFEVLANAPAVARVRPPRNDFGHLVVPFYLQDGTGGEKARVRWEFGIDRNGDGRIASGEGECWRPATHSAVSVTLDGTVYEDAGSEDLVTGADVDDPDNDYTDEDGNPWGKRHVFVWDSVRDLGAPASSRSDVVLRVIPYDDPADGPSWSRPGLPGSTSGFTIRSDPDGLGFSAFRPAWTKPAPLDGYAFTGVRLDEAIVLEFDDRVEPASVTKASIRITGADGRAVDGWYLVDNSSGRGVVTFYPQVAERPAESTTFEPGAGYSLEVPAFDPATPDRTVVRRLGVDSVDTNRAYLLHPGAIAKAFCVGKEVLPDSGSPTVEALTAPDGTSDVPVTTAIEIVFGERIAVDTLDPKRFRVVARDASGRESIVRGEITVRNVVDASGPHGTVRTYARVRFVPELSLPAGTSTVEIRLDAGISDLAGNPLGRTVVYSFTTERGSRDVDVSLVEEFENADRRDGGSTTAFWGTAEPESRGTARGLGTAGALTGLFDGGDGSDGELSFRDPREGGAPGPIYDEVVLDTDRQRVWQFTRLVVPAGSTLVIRGSHAAKILVQGDVVVEGTIDAAGRDGQRPLVRDVTSPDYERSGAGAPGGRGGPGAGDGGSASSYKWAQSEPVSGGDGRSPAADSGGKSPGHGGGGGAANATEAGGGGGAGHATAGAAGGDPGDGSGGAEGAAYGVADLSAGLEGGAGGGAGGGLIHDDPKDARVGGYASGGGGGGGGGALEISTNGSLRIAAGGSILANGGNGAGAGEVRIYLDTGGGKAGGTGPAPPPPDAKFVATHPGGGGGGSGGTVFLRAGEGIDIAGVVDVRGGAGGVGYSSKGIDTAGADGADGRIRLEGPDMDSGGLVEIRGRIDGSGDAIPFTGDGNVDWIVSWDTTVNTDSGLGAPKGAFVDGRFLVRDFVVAKDATLTVEGSRSLKVYASHEARVDGRIESRGSAGSDSTSDDGSSTTGWKFKAESGGSAGAGGGAGGGNGATGDAGTSLPRGDSGSGPGDGGSSVGGGGGGMCGTALTRAFSDHRLYEYHFSGGGGGGGAAEAGDAGTVIDTVYGYAGHPGQGGSETLSLGKVDDRSLLGGGGGGGGGCGGYVYDWTSDDFIDTYFSLGRGSGGGGGGGAIAILTRGRFVLSGSFDVRGGKGGDVRPADDGSSTWAGAGGGGGGGSVLLSAGEGFELSIPVADATGGEPGALIYNDRERGRGGRGGDGGVAFRGLDGLKLLNRESQVLYGRGSLTTGRFRSTRSGVSRWFDTGVWSPQSVTAVPSVSGEASLRVQGAQTDPVTGSPDVATATEWLSDRDAGKLAGHRWIRFRVDLVAGKELPAVDRVKLAWMVRE